MNPPSNAELAARLLTTRSDLGALDRWHGPASIWLTATTSAAEDTHAVLDAFLLYCERVDEGARMLAVSGMEPSGAGAEYLLEAAARAGLGAQVEIVGDEAARKAAFLSADALVLFADDARAELDALAIGTPIVLGGPLDGRVCTADACLACARARRGDVDARAGTAGCGDPRPVPPRRRRGWARRPGAARDHRRCHLAQGRRGLRAPA